MSWLFYTRWDTRCQGLRKSDMRSDNMRDSAPVPFGRKVMLLEESTHKRGSERPQKPEASIITNANSYSESAGAFRLSDGEPLLMPNSLTGELQPWKVTRAHGFSTMIASEKLIAHRPFLPPPRRCPAEE